MFNYKGGSDEKEKYLWIIHRFPARVGHRWLMAHLASGEVFEKSLIR